MKKLVAVAAGLSIALAGGSSLAQSSPGATFDVLGSVMDSTQKEISIQSTMQDRRKEAEAFRDRIQAGTWEFMP